MSMVDALIPLIEKTAWSETGCLEWQGEKVGGYGRVHIEGRRVRASRLACDLAHGPAPEGKPLALHHCDNPACVRGDHLYWGDHADNNRDMVERGRASGGSRKPEFCASGHEFTPENTYIRRHDGGRACRACHRRWDAARRAARRAKRAAVLDTQEAGQ